MVLDQAYTKMHVLLRIGSIAAHQFMPCLILTGKSN